MRGSEDPLTVCVCEPVDRNYADATLVVIAVTRPEADAPAHGAEDLLEVRVLNIDEGFAGCFGAGTIRELHESVAFVRVGDACLDLAVGAEDLAEFGLAAGGAADEEGAAEDSDGAVWEGGVEGGPLGFAEGDHVVAHGGGVASILAALAVGVVGLVLAVGRASASPRWTATFVPGR